MRDEVETTNWVSHGSLREVFKRLVPPPIYGRIIGPAGLGDTRKANRHEIRNGVELETGGNRDTSQISTECIIMGVPSGSPVVIAPMGSLGVLFNGAERIIAILARVRRARMALSTLTTTKPELIGHLAGNLAMFQLYMNRSRAVTKSLMQQAINAGFTDLIITWDVPGTGERWAEQLTGFKMPLDVPKKGTPARDMFRKWWRDYRQRLANGETEYAMFPEAKGNRKAVTGAFSRDRQIEEFAWAAKEWIAMGGRIVGAKGITQEQDAVDLVDAGAGVIIVGNHGDRQQDGAVPAFGRLPQIVRAVAKRARELDRDVEVAYEGDLHSGTDVLKALACGAKWVMVGKSFLMGAAVGGLNGLVRVYDQLFIDSLKMAMSQAGVRSIDEISPRIVTTPAERRADFQAALGEIRRADTDHSAVGSLS